MKHIILYKTSKLEFGDIEKKNTIIGNCAIVYFRMCFNVRKCALAFVPLLHRIYSFTDYSQLYVRSFDIL